MLSLSAVPFLAPQLSLHRRRRHRRVRNYYYNFTRNGNWRPIATLGADFHWAPCDMRLKTPDSRLGGNLATDMMHKRQVASASGTNKRLV